MWQAKNPDRSNVALKAAAKAKGKEWVPPDQSNVAKEAAAKAKGKEWAPPDKSNVAKKARAKAKGKEWAPPDQSWVAQRARAEARSPEALAAFEAKYEARKVQRKEHRARGEAAEREAETRSADEIKGLIDEGAVSLVDFVQQRCDYQAGDIWTLNMGADYRGYSALRTAVGDDGKLIAIPANCPEPFRGATRDGHFFIIRDGELQQLTKRDWDPLAAAGRLFARVTDTDKRAHVSGKQEQNGIGTLHREGSGVADCGLNGWAETSWSPQRTSDKFGTVGLVIKDVRADERFAYVPPTRRLDGVDLTHSYDKPRGVLPAREPAGGGGEGDGGAFEATLVCIDESRNRRKQYEVIVGERSKALTTPHTPSVGFYSRVCTLCR
jgi:hypothetical protein